MGKLLLVVACLVLFQTTSLAQEPAADPIAAKITAAKDAFYSERDKAENSLILLLEKKEAVAKQAGDLKVLEAIRIEIEAFRKEGKLPKSVPLTTYATAMKVAQTKLENIYLAAIKSLTQADKIEEAKELQKQLAEIQGKKNVPLQQQQQQAVNDPLQANTVWEGEGFALTILERKDDSFKARYLRKVGTGFDYEVEGTIKGNKISWQPPAGVRAHPHWGTIEQDKKGFKITISYGSPEKTLGEYTVQKLFK